MIAVVGQHSQSHNRGYIGSESTGVHGRYASHGPWGSLGTQTYGIWGSTGSGGTHAGYFDGRVHVQGVLSKAGGSFKIDHPLEPEGKYLSHSFVESPDMMNIYNGNVITDDDGFAEVVLPDWFGALNRDFRYQLTVIGRFAQAIVEEEITNNRFTIRTNLGHVKVSWMVTGIRQDPWANAHRIPVEEDKPPAEHGTYLYPEGWGQPEAKGLQHRRDQMETGLGNRHDPHPVGAGSP